MADNTLQFHSEHVLARVRRLLPGLADGLVVASPANVQYLTGYATWKYPPSITKQALAVLTPEGKRVLVLPSTDADYVAMGDHFADEVVTYGTFHIEDPERGAGLTIEEQRIVTMSGQMVNSLSWVDALRGVLVSEGLARATLAVDQGNLMHSYWMLLQEVLPEARLVDAFKPMLLARAVKSSYEIDMLRQSAACAERAIQASLTIVARGTTDREIQDAFKRSILDAGADYRFSAVGVGTRTCFPNVQPNGTRLEYGDLIRYDGGCRLLGYPSDLARNATLGSASEKVRRYYRAMLNAEQAAIDLMRPGVPVSEVFDGAVRAAHHSGAPNFRRHHCGHAIGLENYESPLLRPDDRTPLEVGMTFCVETPYYELGFGGIQVEDLVLITPSGAEMLTTLSRELFELGI